MFQPISCVRALKLPVFLVDRGTVWKTNIIVIEVPIVYRSASRAKERDLVVACA